MKLKHLLFVKKLVTAQEIIEKHRQDGKRGLLSALDELSENDLEDYFEYVK